MPCWCDKSELRIVVAAAAVSTVLSVLATLRAIGYVRQKALREAAQQKSLRAYEGGSGGSGLCERKRRWLRADGLRWTHTVSPTKPAFLPLGRNPLRRPLAYCHTARLKRCASLVAPGAGKITVPLWFVTVTMMSALVQLANAVEVSMA